MRRTPLARSSILPRRTPLTRARSRPTPRPKRNPLPPDVHRLVVERDRGRCRRCGDRGVSVHHRIPRGMGGTRWEGIHSPALLVVLCGDGTTGCHGWVESNRAEARLLGWLLSRHLFDLDPQQIPLRWSDRPDRLYLHHDGTTTSDWPTERGDA